MKPGGSRRERDKIRGGGIRKEEVQIPPACMPRIWVQGSMCPEQCALRAACNPPSVPTGLEKLEHSQEHW